MLELITTADGSHSLFSEKFGYTYHSKFGAIQESQRVFMEEGLHFAWSQLPADAEVRIIEIGFGTGLNALMTLLESTKQNRKIHYTAVEAYPLSAAEASQLNYVEQFNAPDFQPLFDQMHAISTTKTVDLTPNFRFEKRISTFESIEDVENWDLIYFDAFAPQAQPELWDENFLKKMWTALKPNGWLTTYCAQGQFKRNLRAVGFEVTALPGPIGKREMTRATKI